VGILKGKRLNATKAYGPLLPTKYQRRLIIFYDILGWRSHIAKAGKEPNSIGQLRRVILAHKRLMAQVSEDMQATTFSDNVIISRALNDEGVPRLLRAVAVIQVASALSGMFIRGGICIGSIFHDTEVVFGPGLNRAYHLESTVAIYPRVILDKPVVKKYGQQIKSFCGLEKGIYFLDPFRLSFMERHFGSRGEDVLIHILSRLKPDLNRPLGHWEAAKILWLVERIARELVKKSAYKNAIGTRVRNLKKAMRRSNML